MKLILCSTTSLHSAFDDAHDYGYLALAMAFLGNDTIKGLHTEKFLRKYRATLHLIFSMYRLHQ